MFSAREDAFNYDFKPVGWFQIQHMLGVGGGAIVNNVSIAGMIAEDQRLCGGKTCRD